MPGCVRVSGPIASCFRRRVESAPADATRWFEPWLAPASCRGAPPCRASIASTSCPLRIRPAPGMPIVCAIRCNSGMSSEERPVPPRLRDLDADAFSPDASGSPCTDPPAAADGAEVPTGASSGALGALLRSSVVSLTNGPSMILGRLGEPARPVDPVQRPPLGPELIRAALIAAECPRFPQRLAFLRASLCIRKLGRWVGEHPGGCAARPRPRIARSRQSAGTHRLRAPQLGREQDILQQNPWVQQQYRPRGDCRRAPGLPTSTHSRAGHPVRH
jgi:hypothetical protein